MGEVTYHKDKWPAHDLENSNDHQSDDHKYVSPKIRTTNESNDHKHMSLKIGMTTKVTTTNMWTLESPTTIKLDDHEYQDLKTLDE